MVGQEIDRSAVGGELRYFQDGRSLFAYVDYPEVPDRLVLCDGLVRDE